MPKGSPVIKYYCLEYILRLPNDECYMIIKWYNTEGEFWKDSDA